MKYEAPDFIKVVNNLNNSFTGSPTPPKCSESVGMAFEVGEVMNGIPCGTTTQWSDYSPNCWIGQSE